MSTVSPSQSNSGDTIEAADINTPVNQLAAVINGGIDATNIAASGVGTSQLAALAVTAAKLNLPVLTYTNTGGGGGTAYYTTIGTIKICWGMGGTSGAFGSGNNAVSLPVGFFTTVQYAKLDIINANTTSYTFMLSTITTSTLTGFLSAALTSGVMTWFAIGT
jgi:hypothetical protein